MSQMTSLLTTGNRADDIRRLRPGDLLIRPDLGDITFSDFPRAKEAIAIGEKAARASAPTLKRFAVSDEEWAAYKARHHRRPASDLVIDRVDVKNKSLVDDDIVNAHLHIPVGRPFDQDAFIEDVMHLYGLDYFGVMRPSFERRESEGDLSIVAPPKPYGRSSLQLGLGFFSDLHGDSAATISARHLLLAVNRRGGEWENNVQIGERMTFATEFYQPLDAGLRWFVSPSARSVKTSQGLWSDGARVADYSLEQYGANLDAGRVLGSWGDVRIGGYVNRTRGEVLTGPEVSPPFAETDSGLHVTLGADTLDSTIFPRHGWRMSSEYAYSIESWGADSPQRRAYVKALGAIDLGRSTVVPGLEIGDNFRTPVNFGSLFALGGLWRLSGLGRNELVGERAYLASVIFYREILKVGLGALRTNIYAGGSVESGGAFNEGDPYSVSALKAAASVFVGADTVIGPAYLACGFAENGRRAYYVSIGQTF
jgi:NTE family protein